MHELKLKPVIQIWVCVNERSHHELPSCQRERGESVIEEIQRQLAHLRKSMPLEIWVNRSLCQGSCHASGVSIVIEDHRAGKTSRRYNSVRTEEVASLLATLHSS